MIKQEYKYINLQSLKENTFDDTSIQGEIMILFIELIDEYIDSISRELPKKHWQELFKATHKIKPNISMFGIESLEEIIQKLDYNFKNEENLETVNTLALNCVAIFEKVKIEIQKELNSMNDEQKENCFSRR